MFLFSSLALAQSAPVTVRGTPLPTAVVRAALSSAAGSTAPTTTVFAFCSLAVAS